MKLKIIISVILCIFTFLLASCTNYTFTVKSEFNTVVFDISYPEKDEHFVKTEKFKKGEEIMLNDYIPENEEFEFDGWFLDSEFNIEIIDDTYIPNGDIYFYGRFVEK